MQNKLAKRLVVSLLCAVLALTQFPSAIMAAEDSVIDGGVTAFTDGEAQVNDNIPGQQGGGVFLEMTL
ncbi:MAG: hypothetical protein Q4D16_06970 [Eubacteriales bacterium]|nr:hypothetical protein [Eubacteriales bacterium]